MLEIQVQKSLEITNEFQMNENKFLLGMKEYLVLGIFFTYFLGLIFCKLMSELFGVLMITQCRRTDLNKRSLPRPKTTTA